MSLRNIGNLTYRKDGEGCVLVTQDRKTDADAAKVDAKAKADTPNGSDCSKINTTNIGVKIWIGKTCPIEIFLS